MEDGRTYCDACGALLYDRPSETRRSRASVPGRFVRTLMRGEGAAVLLLLIGAGFGFLGLFALYETTGP